MKYQNSKSFLNFLFLQTVSRSVSEGAAGDLFIPLTPNNKETHDLVVFNSPQHEDTTMLYQQYRDEPLEKCYDVLQDSATFQVSNFLVL